jgi:methionine-S-sulfoxide reductase
MSSESKLEQATFGGGCFWCTEAVFKELRGVKSVVSGYSGGQTANPTYEQVCSGRTGHAEAVQITFDPTQVTFPELLAVFWKTHDPTTMNRQGHDVGTQYRSVIFYHSDEQRQTAEAKKRELDQSGQFGSHIVTEITKFDRFYPAEDYHQNYFERNPGQGYCAAVIRPKVDKFRAGFPEMLDRPG